MMAVVIGTGLADPPGPLVTAVEELGPLLEHPRTTDVRLEPRDAPRLVPHRHEKLGVQPVDVDVVSLVRTGAHPLQLNLGLRQPRAEMPGEIADRPVGATVVA